MAKVVGTLLVLLAGLGLQAVQAGFRSPESLVRNVYAYYGDRSSDLSSGLPRDPATSRQFFDQSLRGAWSSLKDQPYDFLVQSPTWKLGAVSRIGRASAWTDPGCGGFVEAIVDPVAERTSRRRLKGLARRRIQLRDRGRLDSGRWRRCGWRRVKLRGARQQRLRRRGIRGDQRQRQRADKDRRMFHEGYVVIPPGNRKINYSSGAFSIGSNLSASRPNRFHDCSICGGSGAVASISPPRGCGITIRRANRCKRFCRPPGSCQFSLLKYLGSPTIA